MANIEQWPGTATLQTITLQRQDVSIAVNRGVHDETITITTGSNSPTSTPGKPHQETWNTTDC